MKTDTFINNWEKGRKKGKAAFALIYGITMGSGMFSGSAIVGLMLGKADIQFSLIFLFEGFIGGAIGGLIHWYLNEERYNELINNLPKYKTEKIKITI